MPRLSRLALLLTLPLALAACDTTEPEPAIGAPVFVANQGAFGNDASGGVTTYDPVSGETATLPAPGGLVQAPVVREGKLYLLLNFSDSFSTGRGRLDVIDLETGETERQIDVGTPRGIAFVGETAFVTDLYGAAVTPVNLVSGAPGTPIPVGDNPEGIVAIGRTLYVANSGFGFGSTVSIIDVDSRQVTGTVDLASTGIDCKGPGDIIVGADGRLRVVCTGQSDFSTGAVTTGGAVIALDPATLDSGERTGLPGRLFGGAALGQGAALDPATGTLYVVASASGDDDVVLRLGTDGAGDQPGLEIGGADIAGVGVYDGRLYLARLDPANPFSDNGFVSVHGADGGELARFTAGVVPAGFAFDRD